MDNFIVKEIRKGNHEVFKAVYLEYYEMLVRFAFRYTKDQSSSQDIVQNLFLTVWNDRKRLTIDTSLKAYLFKSVNNRCLNFLRNLNINDKHLLLYINALLAMNEASDRSYAEELHVELLHAINQLPEQVRVIVTKKYFNKMKANDIADELGISVNSVNTQIKRGKTKLRTMLQGKIA